MNTETQDVQELRKPRYNKRKKLQVLQKMAFLMIGSSIFIVLLTLSANFVLLWFDKMPMATETVAVISTFGGIVSAGGMAVYGAVSGYRDGSKNRWGVTHQEIGVNPVQTPFPSEMGNG